MQRLMVKGKSKKRRRECKSWSNTDVPIETDAHSMLRFSPLVPKVKLQLPIYTYRLFPPQMPVHWIEG